MATIIDAPVTRPVLGIPTLFTGFIRIFIPKGMAGYSGSNGCGGCCCGSSCADPRMVLQYVNGNLVGQWGYAGAYQDVPIAPSGFLLPSGNLPVQWLTGASSLEAEMECPCNPSSVWKVGPGSTTVADLGDAATSDDPYELIRSLTTELAKSKAETVKARAELALALTPPAPPAPSQAELFQGFVSTLKPVCSAS